MPRMTSMMESKQDDDALRHGYDKHVGVDMGDPTMGGTYRYGQYNPMFFTREGATLHIEGMYRGYPGFLVAGGPSLARLNLDLMRKPGVLTLGLNNSVKTFRPDLWTCVDDPSRFLQSIWLDPKIRKFVPMAAFNKPIWNNSCQNGVHKWERSNLLVGDCPNVVGIRRNEKFAAHRFLTENTCNWGCHKNYGGCRSVLLSAIRIMWELGVRTIFLVGVDLKMSSTETYAFSEGRTKGAVKNNEATYARMIKEYFPALKPHFEKMGLKVYNCNPDSGLKVFEHMPYEEAVAQATSEIGDTLQERSEGMYVKLEEKIRLGSWESCVKATRGEIQTKEDAD